jgi:hypothetical protein
MTVLARAVRATQAADGLPSMAVGGLPSWAAALLARATASVRQVTVAVPAPMPSLDDMADAHLLCTRSV